MLQPKQISQIHQLHLDGCSDRRIARQLHISRNTVAQYLAQPADEPPEAALEQAVRSSKLDPFKPLIDEWLEQDSQLSARLIFDKLQPLPGFHCGYTLIKDYLQLRRPRQQPRAFTRMEPIAGERFDADWAHFDSLSYGNEKRKLYAFCMARVPQPHALRRVHAQPDARDFRPLPHACVPVLFRRCTRDLV